MPMIRLNPDDMSASIDLARQRHIEALRSGRNDAVSSKDWIDDYAAHLKGAIGEIAYAKWSNQYPKFSVNNFHGSGNPDVGNVEVRYRRNRSYDLIIRKDDPDDGIYVLVRGTPPDVEIVGWIKAADAKKEMHVQDYGGMPAGWFVPVDYLRPMEELDASTCTRRRV